MKTNLNPDENNYFKNFLHEKELTFEVFDKIVQNDELHHRWLYTLSYLENCGARKIKAMEPRNNVPLKVLKHGAEEARHGYFFKRQIAKLNRNPDEEVSFLGGMKSKNYLNLLDIKISKILKNTLKVSGQELKNYSYLLTTYAVELRAESLFSIYQEVLERFNVKINLKTIMQEEENHLADMQEDLDKHPELTNLIPISLEIEKYLYFDLLLGLKNDLNTVLI